MPLIGHNGAVDLLLRILETKSGNLSGSIIQGSFAEGGRVLLDKRLLSKIGQTNVVSSMDDYEDEPIRVVKSDEWQSYGYLGKRGQWISVSQGELNLYGVHMSLFLAQLLVKCNRISGAEIDDLVPNVLWDLGSVKLDPRRKAVSVWFARRMFDDAHRAQIEPMAAKRPPTDTRVIITPTDVQLEVPHHIIVALRDVLASPADVAIDPEILLKRLSLVPTSMLKPIRHSADFGQIHIGNEVYRFTGVRQRAILKILVDAYNRNDPVCITAQVLDEAGAGPKVTNLGRAFNKNKDWYKFIKEDDGHCWIEF